MIGARFRVDLVREYETDLPYKLSEARTGIEMQDHHEVLVLDAQKGRI